MASLAGQLTHRVRNSIAVIPAFNSDISQKNKGVQEGTGRDACFFLQKKRYGEKAPISLKRGTKKGLPKQAVLYTDIRR